MAAVARRSLMNVTKYLAAAAAVAVAGSLAWGAGIYQTLPIIEGAAYCGSSIVVGNAQGGPTGQGGGVAGAGVTTGTVICGQTIPAGPTTFSGTEVLAADIYTPGTAQIAGGPATAAVQMLALGQGPIVVNTTAGAQTIPNNTSLYVENVANTSTTLTLPAAPVGGQIQRVALATAQTTSILFAASAGQSCVPACPFTSAVVAAGSGDAWQWNASNSTWYKIY
jgi:hypothetical protein